MSEKWAAERYRRSLPMAGKAMQSGRIVTLRSHISPPLEQFHPDTTSAMVAEQRGRQ